MLETILAAAIILLMMAGKPKRKFRAYLRGQIDEAMSLGTLGSQTLFSQNWDESVDELCWVSSIRSTWTLSNYTPLTGAGPVIVGVAHSDYTSAEIEAFIENANSWTRGDLVAQEVAKRKIRIVGTFDTPGTDTDPSFDTYSLNDGKPIRTKCGWTLTTGQTLKSWAYNAGSAALGTTDPRVTQEGHANLWPR